MSLIPPVKVGKLQTALHTKAKNSPGYRFYALYDKLYRQDILEWAFIRCRKNGGAPGVDGQSFADIETYGQDRWLDELTEELRNETYRPRPVRRVLIPKGDGKLRPLGIPCIKDRVVQMAAVLVLEPIFEADLEPEQHLGGHRVQIDVNRCRQKRFFIENRYALVAALEKSSSRAVLTIGQTRQWFLQAFHEPAQALQPLASHRDPLRVLEQHRTHWSVTGIGRRDLSRGGKSRPQRPTTSSSDHAHATSGSSRNST
jgi:hypothetical protein